MNQPRSLKIEVRGLVGAKRSDVVVAREGHDELRLPERPGDVATESEEDSACPEGEERCPDGVCRGELPNRFQHRWPPFGRKHVQIPLAIIQPRMI